MPGLLKQIQKAKGKGSQHKEKRVLLRSDSEILDRFLTDQADEEPKFSKHQTSRFRDVTINEGLPNWLVSPKAEPPADPLYQKAVLICLAELEAAPGNVAADLPERAVASSSAEMSAQIRVTYKAKENAEREIARIVNGKGPLQALFDDSAVTDIFVDRFSSVKAIRKGEALETPFAFRSPEEYRLFLTAMLIRANRKLSRDWPVVDFVIEDKWRSRVNIIDPSINDGEEPRICIRVPRLQQISFFDLLQTKTLPVTLASWLTELVATGEANILVTGPVGAGKTVMTTALLSAVGSDRRVVTVEEVPEIFVPSNHVERLMARPPAPDGSGGIGVSELLRAALRRAPHRIILGEIKGEEGKLFLNALEAGHCGSIATLHADNTEDALWRLLDVVACHDRSPERSLMRRIARSLNIVIVMRIVDGSPCLIELAEVGHPQEGSFSVTPLVRFIGIFEGKRRWQILTESSYWIDYIQAKDVALRPGPGLIGPAKAVRRPDGDPDEEGA
jgi:pilus assembly protein CpaF